MPTEQSNAHIGMMMPEKLGRLVELLGAYASITLTGRLADDTPEGDLTPAQLGAIEYVQHHQGCSVKSLSEGLHISIPSATRLVDRLVRKALVDRRESGVDRRLVTLSLTETGLTALQAVHAAHLGRLNAAMQAFQPEERATLMAMLERFLLAALDDVRTIEGCCRHCGPDHESACILNEAHLALSGTPIANP